MAQPKSNDVEAAILEPMLALYPPPVHLRQSPRALALALDVYRRGLSRFERPVLEQAWQKVVCANEFWTWPKLADLVKACEQCHKQEQKALGGQSHDVRIERANDLAYAYRKRFMQTSPLAARAWQEGFERALAEYVQAAAWVQAQMIAGCPHVGYSDHTLFDYTHTRREELEERKEAFFAKAKEQAAKGHVRVTVPVWMIEVWKRSCAQGEGRGR